MAMTNPFDPKTIFFAKHAQHVVLIHFPIALFITGVAFDAASQWTKRRTLLAAAGYNLILAALATFPVILTGLLAWQWALEGQHLKGILLLHLIFGSVTSALMWFIAWIHFRSLQGRSNFPPGVRLALEVVGVAVVGLTGHLGGFLSGVNGPG
jgi:uncharacterized membrane protein